MMYIRKATTRDCDDIRSVHWSAFPEGERAVVSRLAVNLLFEKTTPETFSLVAEAEGSIVGHVAFSPVTIGTNKSYHGHILAPLGVRLEYQHHGIGSQLVESGIQQLSKMGTAILFVYGDPGYYGRFGFSADAAARYIPPYRLEYPFGWQGIVLEEHAFETSPVKVACVASLCYPVLW